MDVTPLQLLCCELQIEISKLSEQFWRASHELANRPGGGNPLGKLLEEYLSKAQGIQKKCDE